MQEEVRSSRDLSPSAGVANARLIAAAPDLFALAKAIDASWSEAIPHGPGQEGDERLFDADTLRIWRGIRAAIAKAEGR